MIRKITHITFALLLFLTTAGFTISKHYCHNSLVEVKIDKIAEPCCESGSCCRTETILVQLDEHGTSQVAAALPVITEMNLFLPIVIEQIIAIVVEMKELELPAMESPPPLKIQTVLSSIQSYLL